MKPMERPNASVFGGAPCWVTRENQLLLGRPIGFVCSRGNSFGYRDFSKNLGGRDRGQSLEATQHNDQGQVLGLPAIHACNSRAAFAANLA